ncbi:venom serine protease Bi-VSP-like [Anastrepha obliqua]|uniref:venom serine protease Bi-VSP-like n=1 Tax=Anastrepha obliqua TaxID=95512 RepID=UPI00240A2994|nr:venom serine protease Bi-VSP-like [Anastrepha obliqua]
MKLFAIVLILCATTTKSTKAQSNCVTPENYYGICSQFNFCPQVVNAYRSRNQQYVAAAQRVCGGNLFCCAMPTNRGQLRPQQHTIRQPMVSYRPSNPFVAQTQQQPIRIVRQQPGINFRSVFNTDGVPSEFVSYRAGQYCRGPDSSEGACLDINSCEPLLRELYTRYSDYYFIEYVRLSNRNCGGTGYVVCCPAATPRDEQPSSPAPNPASVSPSSSVGVCGVVVRSFKKIVGGKASKISDWPWTALLAYPELSSESPFKCGGALVSSRHVVTAAHCIRNDLSYVRLGEYDLSTDAETRHEDIRVAQKERHPNYRTANGRNDIGIIWLERDVQFSNTIKPICLPSSPQLRSKSYINYNPFVVGWGKTMEGGASSNVLQELQIPILDNNVCRDSYRRMNRLVTEDQFDAGVICAGVLSGGKDTCQGDSGGPLMIPENTNAGIKFYLIGVVSYGVGCARPEIPGVYSSVQYFIDWILAKIAN